MEARLHFTQRARPMRNARCSSMLRALAVTAALTIVTSAGMAFTAPSAGAEPLAISRSEALRLNPVVEPLSEPFRTERVVESTGDGGIVEVDSGGPLGGSAAASIVSSDPLASDVSMLSSTQCRWVQRQRYYHVAGIRQYTYSLRTDWCYNGSRIVGTPTIRRGGTAHVAYVDYTGHIGLERGWIGTGNRTHFTYTQGRFRLLGLGVTRTPWVDTQVRHNGTHVHSSGG